MKFSISLPFRPTFYRYYCSQNMHKNPQNYHFSKIAPQMRESHFLLFNNIVTNAILYMCKTFPSSRDIGKNLLGHPVLTTFSKITTPSSEPITKDHLCITTFQRNRSRIFWLRPPTDGNSKIVLFLTPIRNCLTLNVSFLHFKTCYTLYGNTKSLHISYESMNVDKCYHWYLCILR